MNGGLIQQRNETRGVWCPCAYFSAKLFFSPGLGMYESPLFLTTHEEESGGRSVPTTPLQAVAPGISLYQSHLKRLVHFL